DQPEMDPELRPLRSQSSPGVSASEDFPAQFDADVRDHAGRMSRADPGAGDLGYGGVLHPHDEAEAGKREGAAGLAGEDPAAGKAGQEAALHGDRKGILAPYTSDPGPVDQDGAERGTGDERTDGDGRNQRDPQIADHKVVGKLREIAGHVRRVGA